MASTLPAMAVPGQRLGPTTTFGAGPGTHIHNAVVFASIAGPVVVEPAQPPARPKSLVSVSRNPSTNPKATGAQAVTNLTARNAVPTPGSQPAGGSSSSVQPQKKLKLRFNTLPAVESTVLARVTRVQKRQATVSILVVLDDNITSTTTSVTNPTSTSTSDNDNIEAILASAANPENHSSADELRFQALIRKEDVRAVEKDRVVMDEMFRVGDIVRGTVISLGDQSFYYLTTARNDLGVVMARSESGNMMFPVSWKEMRDPVTGLGEPRKVARPF